MNLLIQFMNIQIYFQFGFRNWLTSHLQSVTSWIKNFPFICYSRDVFFLGYHRGYLNIFNQYSFIEFILNQILYFLFVNIWDFFWLNKFLQKNQFVTHETSSQYRSMRGIISFILNPI